MRLSTLLPVILACTTYTPTFATPVSRGEVANGWGDVEDHSHLVERGHYNHYKPGSGPGFIIATDNPPLYRRSAQQNQPSTTSRDNRRKGTLFSRGFQGLGGGGGGGTSGGPAQPPPPPQQPVPPPPQQPVPHPDSSSGRGGVQRVLPGAYGQIAAVPPPPPPQRPVLHPDSSSGRGGVQRVLPGAYGQIAAAPVRGPPRPQTPSQVRTLPVGPKKPPPRKL